MREYSRRLCIALGTGWSDPDASIGGPWRGHLAVRLGVRNLTAHLGVQPVVPFAVALVDAVVALREQRPAAPVPLADGHVLTLRGPLRMPLLSVLGPRPIVADEPATAVETATKALLLELREAAPSPSAQASLRAAQERLDRPRRRQRVRHSSGAPQRLAPVVPADADRPLLVRWVNDALLIETPGQSLRARFASPAEPAEVLVGALEAVLHARDWPQGRHFFRFEDHDDRRLQLVRRDERVEVVLLDPGDHALLPIVDLGVTGFARVVTAFLGECLGAGRFAAPIARRLRRLRTDALRLASWAEALAAGDRVGAGDAPIYAPPKPSRAPRRAPLPVTRLMHLAYRRRWRAEAPGLVRVDAHGGHLLVFDETGARGLAAEDGRQVWQRRGVRPLPGPSAPFGIDEAGGLVALEPTTGKVRWRTHSLASVAPIRAVLALAGATVIGGGDRVVVALDDRGEVAWRYAVYYGGAALFTSTPGLLWVLAEDGFLHGLDAAAGRAFFQVRVLGEPVGPARPTGAGLLVATNREPDLRGEVSLVDPRTGVTRWRRTLGAELQAAPTVKARRMYSLVHDANRAAVECMTLGRGLNRWRTVLDVTPPVTLSAIGELLLVKGADGHLVCLGLREGEVRWTAPADDPDLELAVNAPVRPCRGLLLAPGRHVRAIDPSDGRVVHALDCGELVPSWLHVWPNADLAIAEDDAVARYHLGGHLALVD